MSQNDRNMKISINNLYAAAVESTDYMMQIHQKQKIIRQFVIFGDELLFVSI